LREIAIERLGLMLTWNNYYDRRRVTSWNQRVSHWESEKTDELLPVLADATNKRIKFKGLLLSATNKIQHF